MLTIRRRPKMDQNKMGLFIKDMRKEKGFTQEQLAETLGVSNRSISRWENGANMPDFDIVIHLAKFFNVSIEELLDGEKKEDIVNKEKEEAMLKVSDYENEVKLKMSRRVRWIFVVGFLALIINMIIESQDLRGISTYDAISGFTSGSATSIMFFGIIYTSKYMNKIIAFKMRLLGRE